jgi:hypothetical protein
MNRLGDKSKEVLKGLLKELDGCLTNYGHGMSSEQLNYVLKTLEDTDALLKEPDKLTEMPVGFLKVLWMGLDDRIPMDETMLKNPVWDPYLELLSYLGGIITLHETNIMN